MVSNPFEHCPMRLSGAWRTPEDESDTLGTGRAIGAFAVGIGNSLLDRAGGGRHAKVIQIDSDVTAMSN
jgi:hypothetical protein